MPAQRPIVAPDSQNQPGRESAPAARLPEVLAASLRLGMTSFGGPVAHLGYLHREYVERRRWIDEATYADLVALCNFLPGPVSSQIGMAVGIGRAGLLGGVVAWIGFTLPSAALMFLLALGLGVTGPASGAGWLHGLAVVAVAVVALAVRGMAERLCPDRARGTIAVAACIAILAWGGGLAQVGVLVAGGIAGWMLYRGAQGSSPADEPASDAHRAMRADCSTAVPQIAVGGAPQPSPSARPLTPPSSPRSPVTRRHAAVAWTLFLALLVGLPIAAAAAPGSGIDVFARFFRTGSLVFGGGHVVLPLLEADVVTPGWTTSERFLAGYGAVQAVPGPLLSIAAYLGAVIGAGPGGLAGAALALVAIFLPSYLLIVGALPFWARLRGSPGCQAALRGTNAAVVGLLLAALFHPVWTSAIGAPADFALALAAYAALALWRVPPWLVVVLGAGAGWAIAR